MAQIKKLASKSHHYFTLNVNEVESSINVDNNTSDVSYSFVLSPKVKGYDWSIGEQITWTININGTTYTGHIKKYDGSSTVTLKSGTQTITHDQDGTQTISISFTVTDTSGYSFTCGNASGSDTLTLTTIPRASQITVGDANIGSSTNITINKNSANFTTTLYYKASGQGSYTKIVDKTSNQVYGWTVPTSFYALIPNSKTITCQFYAETYNGNTLVGTSNTVTATFTATGNPTINSCTLRSTDNTTTSLVGNTRMIRYISTVTATVSASGNNSATISSIKVNGVTATNNVATFTKATTNSFEVVVTDSRGYSTTNTYTMTSTNYIQLTLNTTISRNEPTDGKVNISFSGNYFNGNFTGSSSIANTLTVQYRSREAGGSWGSWTTISHTKSGNTYSGSTQLSNYDYTKQYEFQMQAIDKVSTVPLNGIIVSKGQPIYWWNDSSFNVTEDIKASKKIVIPKSSSTSTTGIYNDAGQIVFQSYANNNSILNAGGGGLYLGYQNTNGINFLNSKTLITSTGSIFLNNTKTYLYKNADGASWWNARDYCLVRSYVTNNSGSWFPILSAKTQNGDWSLGTRGNNDVISLSYVLDTNYNSSTNTQTYRLDFPQRKGTLATTSVSLFSGSQATGEITLSSSSANFTYIEIFYSANDSAYSSYTTGYKSVKIPAPNGKKVMLDLDYDNGTYLYQCRAAWTFNGTSLTKNKEVRWRIPASTAANTRTDTTTSDSNITIRAIVGYQE